MKFFSEPCLSLSGLQKAPKLPFVNWGSRETVLQKNIGLHLPPNHGFGSLAEIELTNVKKCFLKKKLTNFSISVFIFENRAFKHRYCQKKPFCPKGPQKSDCSKCWETCKTSISACFRQEEFFGFSKKQFRSISVAPKCRKLIFTWVIPSQITKNYKTLFSQPQFSLWSAWKGNIAFVIFKHVHWHAQAAVMFFMRYIRSEKNARSLNFWLARNSEIVLQITKPQTERLNLFY